MNIRALIKAIKPLESLICLDEVNKHILNAELSSELATVRWCARVGESKSITEVRQLGDFLSG